MNSRKEAGRVVQQEQQRGAAFLGDHRTKTPRVAMERTAGRGMYVPVSPGLCFSAPPWGFSGDVVHSTIHASSLSIIAVRKMLEDQIARELVQHSLLA
jgi:hypothetical protein